MSVAYTAYRHVSAGLFFIGFPVFWGFAHITGRHRQNLSQRLGRYPHSLRPARGGPRVWLHAASVGEVSVAMAILDALADIRSDADVVVSTTTPQGLAVARARLPERVPCVLAPLDASAVVARGLRHIRPDVLVCVETELWPCWLVTARQAGIRTALVNGRISQGSFRGYLRARCLMTSVLDHVDAFSMISDGDARRIRAMGADGGRIRVNGNAKFDAGDRRGPVGIDPEAFRRLFNLTDDTPVWVAGSTRSGEDAMVLEAFMAARRRHPGLTLILAPRHVQRAADIVALARQRQIFCQLRSDLRPGGAARRAPLIILDSVGELNSVYQLAHVVFCGGSLVPKGGQNVLEAAALGKPVLYGPYMDDFLAESAALTDGGGGRPVADSRQLGQAVADLLSSPEAIQRMGAAALRVVHANRGAAARHAAVIADLLPAPQKHVSRRDAEAQRKP
ncbi:MAG: glycosyltransferase N-terminal domain-containing protein [Pseudomonadota bacterium]